ncbi:MAG: PilZ domain-containing protein [Bradymonadaceae bacterium]|nr:PilZ domain-containing protein [Lujinxingiaceae bacterium]
MDDDRRGLGRINCDIFLNKVEHGHTNICRALDVSLGGMRLERMLEAHTARNASVQLQFELPGVEEPIWVGATKVYEDDAVVGVKFTNISHGHFMRLRGWLRDQALVQSLPAFSA